MKSDDDHVVWCGNLDLMCPKFENGSDKGGLNLEREY